MEMFPGTLARNTTVLHANWLNAMKLFPSKWKQTLKSTEIPALPFHLSLVQMLFISAFVFDAVLCLRPLTHLEPYADLRGLVIGPEGQEAEAPFLLSGSTGWWHIRLSLFSLLSLEGICIPSSLVWTMAIIHDCTVAKTVECSTEQSPTNRQNPS